MIEINLRLFLRAAETLNYSFGTSSTKLLRWLWRPIWLNWICTEVVSLIYEHVPDNRTVPCPLGAVSASWSKVMICPPAFKILLRARSVNFRAHTCEKTGKRNNHLDIETTSHSVLSSTGETHLKYFAAVSRDRLQKCLSIKNTSRLNSKQHH